MHEPAGVRDTGGLSKARPYSVHPCDPDPVQRTPSSHADGTGHSSQTAQRLSSGLLPATLMRDG